MLIFRRFVACCLWLHICTLTAADAANTMVRSGFTYAAVFGVIVSCCVSGIVAETVFGRYWARRR